MGLLVGRPLLALDGAVEVVVVPFAALLAAAVLDLELLLQHSRDFCPLLDASLLVEFPEGFVFLGRAGCTSGVQAFL